MNINAEELISKAGEWAVSLLPTIVGALVVTVLGWIAIGWIDKAIRRFFEKTEFDEALETFMASFIAMALKVVLVVVVVGMLGVQTTSLIALLGAAGLAVGLALQGSLANFAGGVLILIFKPFKLGDYIEAQGVSGTVEEIEIFNTILASLDNKRIVLPNGNLSNDVVINYSAQKTRRHDFTIGIGYTDDIQKAKDTALKVVHSLKWHHDEPEPTVGVVELGDSSVNLQIRFWVANGDFLVAKYDFLEQIKTAFDKEGISIPFPQRDIHLYNQ